MSDAPDPTDLLTEALDADGGPFVELRYHKKRSRSVSVEKGRVDQARIAEHTGVGVRVLEQGTWGFASTDRLETAAVVRAVESARAAARASAAARSKLLEALPPIELARGRFDAPGYEELAARPIEESLDMACTLEQGARASRRPSPAITTWSPSDSWGPSPTGVCGCPKTSRMSLVRGCS